jgi:hypothetical protein
MEAMDHDSVPGWVRYRMGIATGLPAPPESVAGQLTRQGRTTLYLDRYQKIDKSAWFLTIPEDNPVIHEYCNYIPSYNFALSVIWED